MPVAAGVVRDLGMAARRVLAARDMSAERRRATALDRTHHLQLVEAHMPAVGLTPSRAVIAENVRDLQSWSSHSRAVLRRRRLFVASHTPAARRAQALQGALDLGRVRAKPESRECPCRARADGSRSCGEANAGRASY